MVAKHRITVEMQATLSSAPHAAEPPQPPMPADRAIVADAEYDLVIIGSGPAALALLARMLEERPAALYTEDERSHLHWLHQRDELRRGRTTLKTYRSPHGVHVKAHDKKEICTRLLRRCACPRVLVVDKLGEGWCGQWNRSFQAFEIAYLRSPMFFHPSPSGLDDLLTFSQRTGLNRLGHPSFLYDPAKSASTAPRPDLIEIRGVVGKEVSKHKKKKNRSHRATADLGVNINERSREDFYTPSTDLFAQFVQQDIIERYGLPGAGAERWPELQDALNDSSHTTCHGPELTVAKGTVSKIQWHDDGTCICGDQDRGFTLKLACGTTIASKAVVSAIGPGGIPAIPLQLKSQDSSRLATSGNGWCHSSALALPGFAFPPEHVACSSRHTTLLIIGGGLTSAQIADLALKHDHFNKVILLLRGHLKCKPFDVGNEWMGKYSNLHKMKFWQTEEPDERLEQLKSARCGGSITPPYARVLKKWEAAGRLEVRTLSEIDHCEWDAEAKVNRVTIVTTADKVLAAGDNQRKETVIGRQALDVDYIVTATGALLGFTDLPFLQEFSKQNPISVYGGLPLLNEDLQWRKDVPLFAIGAASALQIGPAAFNLGGIREAADRVAVRLAEMSLSEETHGGEVEQRGESEESNDYPLSFTHFGFEALSMEA